jgi:hypothetical protein
MSTTPYPGPDEVIIPSRIYFDEGKRIDVKVWPKTIRNIRKTITRIMP